MGQFLDSLDGTSQRRDQNGANRASLRHIQWIVLTPQRKTYVAEGNWSLFGLAVTMGRGTGRHGSAS
jgi:hypothetical protein